MGTAVIYARTSVCDGEEKSKALERQEAACREAAKKEGDHVVKNYRDVSPAGAADRPGLRAFLDDLQGGESVDRLYVLGFDRLGRGSAEKFTEFLDEMAERGVEVRIVPARTRAARCRRTGPVRPAVPQVFLTSPDN